MPRYAEKADLVAYAPYLVLPSDEIVNQTLDVASADIDRFLGAVTRSATGGGLKYDLTLLDTETAQGLINATAAQAEYRLMQGNEFFIQGSSTVEGPDFTITSSGSSTRLAPKAIAELQSFRILPTHARARP